MSNYLRQYHAPRELWSHQLCCIMTSNLWQHIHIGKLIRRFAEERNITQAQLANMVSLASKSVYNIYNTPNINTEMLRRIGQALGVNFFEIIYKEEKRLNATMYGEDDPDMRKAAEAEVEYHDPKKNSVFMIVEVQDGGGMILKGVELDRQAAETKVSKLKPE